MQKYIQKQWLIQDSRQNLYYLHYSDILYLETCNRYVRIITRTETIITNQTLIQIQKELPDNFLRIHRSIVINLEHIFKISRYEIKLRNGTILPVPEKKYMLIKEQISLYMNRKTFRD